MKEKEQYLLTEVTTFDFEEKESTIEDSDGHMILQGVIQKANTLNQNGRVYPRHLLEREIENYSKLVRENRAFGELEHADSPMVNLERASHMITKIWMEGDVVKGKVKILETPCGKIIKAIIKAGGKPGISSRALGSLSKKDGVDVVQDDLEIKCWDFVSEPSTPGAFMHLTEAKLVDRNLAIKTLTKSDRVDRILNDLLIGRTK